MKIGLLGGTFDPVHIGHLLIAEQTIQQVDLDQVWFIPANQPPHKTDQQITSAYHRAEMVKLAIENHSYFQLSMIEMERTGLSYTVDTIEILTQKYPITKFYLIAGADMVNDMPNWHKIKNIIQLINIIGVYRPHVNINETPKWMSNRLIWIKEEIGIHVSSSFIRNHITNHRLLQYVLPVSVLKYIEENCLYED